MRKFIVFITIIAFSIVQNVYARGGENTSDPFELNLRGPEDEPPASSLELDLRVPGEEESTNKVKAVTYRQIMNEFDRYLEELDQLDREIGFASVQNPSRAVNPELMQRREHLLNQLLQMQNELAKNQVDVAQSLMGSSTGFSSDRQPLSSNGPVSSRQGSIGSSGPRGLSPLINHNSPSSRQSSGGDHSGDNYFEFEPGPRNHSHKLSRHRMKATKRLTVQKDALVMERVLTAAKLASIPVTKTGSKAPKGQVSGGTSFSGRSVVHGSTLPIRR